VILALSDLNFDFSPGMLDASALLSKTLSSTTGDSISRESIWHAMRLRYVTVCHQDPIVYAFRDARVLMSFKKPTSSECCALYTQDNEKHPCVTSVFSCPRDLGAAITNRRVCATV